MSYTTHGHHNIWTPKTNERQPVARQCGGQTHLYCRDCNSEMTASRSEIEKNLREAFVKTVYPYALARTMALHSISEAEKLLRSEFKSPTSI